MQFMLVGSVDVTTILYTGKYVPIQNPTPVQVLAGDLIGFTFKGKNPIPYDHTFHCSTHGGIKFRPEYSTNVGEIYSFPVKNDENMLCRMYSLYAELTVASKI